MAIFRKKQDDPLTHRAQELEQEIAKIQAEIQRLKRLETTHQEIRKPRKNLDDSRLFIEGDQPFLEDKENLTVKKIKEAQPESAKFDLIGELKRRFGLGKKTESEKTKLIQTLMAGSIQGPPLLKYEQRVARNRFLLLFTIFIIVLLGVLSLLTKAR